MVFNPNIPQSTDFLSNSQGDLLTNNSQLDIVFGIDHYKYSDVSGNKGKHNYVTTPLAVNVPPTASGHPDTTSTELKFYAMQDTANIGLLQYSRGWDAAGATSGVPCAVTYLQSPNAAQILNAAASSTLPIFDFTGITNYAMCKVIIFNNKLAGITRPLFEGTLVWDGTTNVLTINEIIDTFATGVRFEQNANLFQMRRNADGIVLDEIFWSIQFYRIVV